MANNANAGIFLYASGQPIRIFVEPTELTFRPKLIRDLRSRGAVIAHYPTDAQVIIVDPESDAGKQFVEDWCSEPGKVVLHHDWVTRSIEEGRALLGHDEWGGMRLSTGLNGHVATMNPGHPLPTPPPDNGGRAHTTTNPGVTALPTGAPIMGQVPMQANAFPAPTQNGQYDRAAIALAAQILQSLSPADLQSMLGAQVPLSNILPAHVPAPGPSNHLAAYDGPQVAAPGVAATDFMTPSSSQSVSTSMRRHSRSSPDPSSSVPAKRRKSLGAKPMSSRSKGKERGEPPAKLSRSPSPEEDDGSSSADEEHPGSPRETDEVFTQDDGVPIAFWVQMETKQRGDLVQMIKKNKGRVVSDIAESDIVVLSQDFPSKNFDHWNKIALQHNKVTVQSRYIRQCVKDCALLDPDGFGVEAPPKPRGGRGRGRPLGSGTVRRSRPQTYTVAPPSPRAFRLSASPPPPKRTEGWQIGKFLYTSEEIEYFRRYVPILMTRYPDSSKMFLAEKLHEKMPHHSAHSWNSWMRREPQAKFMAQCKDKTSDHRSGQPEKPQSVKTTPQRPHDKAHETSERHTAHADEPVSAKKPAPAESTSAAEGLVARQVEADNARDFDNIASFLANGGADNRTDEEVWEMLAKEHPNHTATEWQKFWVKRGTDINEEVRRRMVEVEAPTA